MKLHNINCIDIVAENIHGTDVVIHETQDRNVIANQDSIFLGAFHGGLPFKL